MKKENVVKSGTMNPHWYWNNSPSWHSGAQINKTYHIIARHSSVYNVEPPQAAWIKDWREELDQHGCDFRDRLWLAALTTECKMKK